MKLKYTILLSVLAFVFSAGLRAQAPETATTGSTAPEAAPAPQYTDAQVFEMLGWFVATQSRIAEFEPTPELTDAFVKGLKGAITSNKSPYEIEKIAPDMDRVLMGRQTDYVAKQKAAAAAKAAEFFAEIKKQPNVVFLPNGLAYEIIKPGEGAYPTADDSVKIHYKGTLIDGTTFDSSYEREDEGPAVFPLSGVIRGMTEGLQKINKGGKIKLYIPSELGYGERASQAIPAYSPLVFEVELLDIIPPTPPTDVAPAVPAAPAAAK